MSEFNQQEFKMFWVELSPLGKKIMALKLMFSPVYLSQVANDKTGKYKPSDRLIRDIDEYIKSTRAGEAGK